MVNLSRDLGLKVVAEGIETADQLERLREMGCELSQGYYFAKPLPGGDAAELLATPSAKRSRSSGAFGECRAR